MATIYLAGGCFWGVEEYFQRTPGVIDTQVGYINSKIKNPSYQEVCTGRTQAAEGLKLSYDPKKISQKEILDHFYKIIDPYLLNRQGNDIGSQYRTGVYYQNEEDKKTYEADRLSRQVQTDRQILVEVEVLENFYPAEEVHQRYLKKNPMGYCHIQLPQID
ncbi:MAG: peptide-methionine (S)-S-oxide reductase MsrA [Tissierellia bacterium]|nr:peptide-methionine (S)-S-oxide reductase MsrA [Tissierellia bacterium]